MDRPPIDGVLIHVRDALATDGRVGELGLDVVSEGDVIVVRGAVSTAARQSAVCELVDEVLRQYGVVAIVRDETRVPGAAAPTRAPEQL
jgi:hypothetical protein